MGDAGASRRPHHLRGAPYEAAVIVRLTFPNGQESFEAVDNFVIVEDDDGTLKIAVDSHAFVGND